MEEDSPVKVNQNMVKTFSKILDEGNMFGEETMFNRNYRRKVNAVAVSNIVLVLVLPAEAFDILVKDKIRRDRLEIGTFIH